MADKNNFDETVRSLLEGMSGVLSTKTVVGEPITVGDTMILPLVDVSFGMGAGARKDNAKDSAQGGMGVKMSPSAALVIKDGSSRLINIKNQDTMTKVLDMIPELVGKFTDKKEPQKKDDLSDEDIIDAVASESSTEPKSQNKE